MQQMEERAKAAVQNASTKTKGEQLIRELLLSERVHVQNLNTFLQEYVIPIRDKKILTAEELQSILCNLELIRSWNVQFLSQLEGLLEDETGFGELFLQMVHPPPNKDSSHGHKPTSPPL